LGRRKLEKFALLFLSTWFPVERTTTHHFATVVVLTTCGRGVKPHISNSFVKEENFNG